MSIVQNTYTPDTCTCELVYQWDDTLPEDQRVLSFHHLLHKGAEHAAIVDSSILQVVFEEKLRKDQVLELCRSKGLRTEPSGDGKRASQVAWAYTPNRTLALRVRAMSSKRAAIKNACEALVGSGKVTVSAL